MEVISGIFGTTIAIAIIVFIVTTIVKSMKKDSTEEDFQNIMRAMYIYIVMIIFLILIVASTILVFNGLMGVLLPDVINNRYNSIEISKNANFAQITSSAATLFLCIPLFLYHSGLAKKERKVQE